MSLDCDLKRRGIFCEDSAQQLEEKVEKFNYFFFKGNLPI